MANNIPVLDATGATKVYKTTDTASVHTAHNNIDALPGTAEADIAATKTNTDTLAGAVATAKVQTDVKTITLPTVVLSGQTAVTTAGTQVALAGSATVKSHVMVKALGANTGKIYVGDSAVSSTTGYELSAGESVPVSVADIATIWIDSSVNGEGVSYVGS